MKRVSPLWVSVYKTLQNLWRPTPKTTQRHQIAEYTPLYQQYQVDDRSKALLTTKATLELHFVNQCVTNHQ